VQGVLTWGDADCDGSVNPVDGLKLLRYDAGLSVSKQPACPALGSSIDAVDEAWGDWDCDDAVGPIDALKTLRYDAGLSVAQQEPCPEFNEEI
jgi:hypothetical protein